MMKLTHTREESIHMVDITSKPITERTATAEGEIHLKEDTIRLIKEKRIEKGNVLATAQIAAINAIKNTWNIIPLCHPLPITSTKLKFKILDDKIIVKVTVKCNGKTGVEMEALTGVSVALLTIWDMVKSIEKDEKGQYPHTRISNIKVVEKKKSEQK
ncbi:MAG: cyclic pyranopterin monophosphate synthase MoaC [Methanothermobacter sp.]|jgi:cyclic pyranopterin phosphate synthase|nr:cyclic pyranopterin monophosphate synthase MoaC [Methanothermobacter tenebrarum]MDD3454915.1 cyclic pyranopterin monophosphate synthase MoaC [Methanobacteriales archaeon]MDI6881806.1 cyclic pyranopterin monophosphate synthase MoaC [Methanothermobacter sp.]MDX9693652.1 cyclic pyranopterin monophosphate synthase MoaC [Methanothermobacter sp.]